MTPEVTTMATPEAFSQGTMILFIVLMIRGTIWKGIALWKAGTKKQLARFVCLFIFNTAGILPILYLLFRQTKGKK
ncbi:MAG TPA: DUF5652 family protein [Candidatus Absconditabacterales bacterium]|nr:DUF5652 family protein [Candidatus Absconditabacterales bacterium]